eukprot:3272491-Amphidinium_carterae.1
MATCGCKLHKAAMFNIQQCVCAYCCKVLATLCFPMINAKVWQHKRTQTPKSKNSIREVFQGNQDSHIAFAGSSKHHIHMTLQAEFKPLTKPTAIDAQ